MKSFRRSHIVSLTLFVLWTPVQAQEATLKQGEWDGKTETAALQGPYEDPYQLPPVFGAISYFSQPWRSYMDTWPSTVWGNSLGVNMSGDEKYIPATAQILRESGFRFVRVEVGWNSVDWNDHIRPDLAQRLTGIFKVYKENGIRPMILLNAHHGVPLPLHDVPVTLTQDAKKGERTVKFSPGTTMKLGYTGFNNLGDYKAAFPLITSIAADGTAQLSAPLPADLKAGDIPLQELKYQPFQGTQMKDGTPVPAAQETLDGWRKYVEAVGTLARDAMGSPTDSGFDIEVWNEQTFGSDFLDINRYYDPKLEYAQPLTYQKTRSWTTAMRPDAQLEFKQTGFEAILPVTVDFFNDPKNGFHQVRVNSGFSNQQPFAAGPGMWDGQNGLNKHYYTGSDRTIISPEKPLDGRDHMTYDAFGKPEGKQEGREWWQIVPGSNFVPRLSITYPESTHSAFKTETLERDVYPDSRHTNTPDYMGPFGRYTHNGDYRTPHFWETETNYYRAPWDTELMKEAGVKEDDPRLKAFNDAINSKMLLRQAVFHVSKGIERLFIFATNNLYNEFGMFPPQFFSELDKSDGKITPAARATLPVWPKTFAQITQIMSSTETLQAPRQLRVDALVEHKPRLVFAGDGTPANPSRYNRDFFAFLPFQVSTQKFVVPYYVVTPDVTLTWNPKLDLLDPKRYDMPAQDFDVTIGNFQGTGAKISALDPTTGQIVPVRILSATPSTLTVHLPTTDTPRFLVIEEAKAGIQISNAKLEAPQAGQAVLSWTLNRPANAVRVSYGGDWPQRSANEISIQGKPGQTAYRVVLPVAGAEMVAARIRVAADGIGAVWPRWDEDPQGQVTLPNAKPHPRGAAPARPVPAAGQVIPMVAPVGVALTLEEKSETNKYSLHLPAGAVATGPEDDRTIVVGRGDHAVTLRVRYLSGQGQHGTDYLPFQSATDRVDTSAVTLPGGKNATLSNYTLNPTAYPGVTDTSRRYLWLPLGNNGADLLLLSVTGTPAAIDSEKANIEAIFASVTAQ